MILNSWRRRRRSSWNLCLFYHLLGLILEQRILVICRSKKCRCKRNWSR